MKGMHTFMNVTYALYELYCSILECATAHSFLFWVNTGFSYFEPKLDYRK